MLTATAELPRRRPPIRECRSCGEPVRHHATVELQGVRRDVPLCVSCFLILSRPPGAEAGMLGL